MTRTTPDRSMAVREAMWPKEGRIGWSAYALLDGARDPRIRAKVQGSGLEHACLWAGKLPEAMMSVAPWLVRLREDAPLANDILENGFPASWGVLALSGGTLEELRRHFRRLLKVQDPRGNTLIFRFYDPRVLRVFLPTCTAGELATVFGPVGMFLMPSEGDGAIRFHRQAGALVKTDVAAPAEVA